MNTFPKRIPIPEYDELTAVRYSHLKHILRSPRHFLHAEAGEFVQTPAMALGTAAHAATLEPVRFAAEFVVYPGPVRRGKEYELFRRQHAGATILTEKERVTARGIAHGVKRHPLAAALLAAGEPEVALQWTDPDTQIVCKGRVDWVTETDGKPVIVGLKTARDISKYAFQRQAANLQYHMQWAMYSVGHLCCTGRKARLIEIVVESQPPHDVVVFEIGEDVLEPGLALLAEALSVLQRCRETDEWPGQYAPKIIPMALPPWAAGVPQGADVALDMTGLED